MKSLASLIVFAVAATLLGVFGRDDRSGSNVGVEAAASTMDTSPEIEVEAHYDFGSMFVGETRRHAFTLRNTGTAPLTLALASTTCKCTLAELGRTSLAPNEQTEIVLEWQGETWTRRFRHGARLNTNAPRQPQLDLIVEGRVQTALGVWPDLIYFREVPRRATRQLNVVLFSHAEPPPQILRVESTMPEVRLRVGELSDDVRAQLDAPWVRDLAVEISGLDRLGTFTGHVRVFYRWTDDASDAEPRLAEFPFAGDVVGHVSIHGRDVVGKVLNLGSISASGGDTTAYVHVRSEDDVRLEFVRATPEFLQVELGTPQRLSASVRRIPLRVVVPPQAPQVTYADGRLGEIELRPSSQTSSPILIPIAVVTTP